MKTYKILIPLIVLGIFIFTFVPIAGAEDLLKITELKGKVLVKIQPSTEWADAKVGQALNMDDSIKTEADAGAVLEFPDKSSVTLKADSELSVEQLLWDATSKKVKVKLKNGALRAILNRLGEDSEFKVKTPNAVCGVRGTIFYVMIEGILTRLYVEDGLVQFRNEISGETRDVGQGMSAASSDDGKVSEPSEPPAAEKDAIAGGWDAGLVAEPYTEPEGPKRSADDVAAPEVRPENVASQT